MSDRKDVDLRIRATDTTKQNLQSVRESIKGITDALNEQVGAAKRGEDADNSLRQSLKALDDQAKELLREQAIVNTFNRQAEAIDRAQKVVDEAAAKYEKLRGEMDAVEKPTKKMADAVESAEKKLGSAQSKLERSQAAMQGTVDKLAAAGIQIDHLAQSQQHIVESYDAVIAQTRRATEAQEQYAEAVKNAKAEDSRKQEHLGDLEREIVLTQKLRDVRAEVVDKVHQATEAQARETRQNELAGMRSTAVDAFTKLLDEQDAITRATEQHQKAYNEQLEREIELHQRVRAQKAEQVAADRAADEQFEQQRRQSQLAGMRSTATDAFGPLVEQQAKADRDSEAFKRLADNVRMAENGFRSFAQTTAAVSDVGGGLRSITDPAAQARETLKGLETQIQAVATVARAGKQETTDYAGSVRTLQAAMKSVVGTGEAVDAYRQQVALVRQSRAAFQEARLEVTSYASAIKAADVADESLGRGLQQAQQRLNAAQREMQKAVESARSMQDALRRMGIATNDLAGTEQRLVTSARAASTALEQLNAAYKRTGDSSEDAAKKFKLFGEGSRESLSWGQRVRGELIALATAYVGLQGAIGLASGAIQAFVEKQAVENRLGIVLGTPDTKAIGGEYDYVHRQAERLGIGINELADSYSRFALSAKNANMNMDQTKFAFERITEVMRVNHASSEAVNGAFYQLEQMLSKNKIQMDDLRQASNWIPGLEGMLARGLGMVSVKQLFDQMKKGSVDAKTAILALGEEMERQYSKQIPEALKSLQAEQGRFNTSLYDFKLLIANSGFADAYTNLLQRITAFFKSTDGQRFAKNISDAFSRVVDVLVLVVDNINDLIRGFEAFIALKIAMWFSDLSQNLTAAAIAFADQRAQVQANAAAMTELAAAMGPVTVAEATVGDAALVAGTKMQTFAGMAATALGLVSKAFNILTGLFIGWQIGEILDSKFDGIHRFSTKVAEEFAYLWDRVTLGLERMMQILGNKLAHLPQVIGNAAREVGARLLENEDGGGPGKAMADKLRAGKVDIPDDPAAEAAFQAKLKAIEARHEANMKMIDKHGGYTNDGRKLTIEEEADQKRDAMAKDPQGYRAQADLVDLIKTKEKELNDIIDERSKKIIAIQERRKNDKGYSEAQAEKDADATVKAYGPKIKTFVEQTQKQLRPLIDTVGFKVPPELQDLNSRLQAAKGRYEPNLEVDEKKKKGDPIGTMDRSLQNDLSTMLARVDRTTVGTFDERLKASGRAIEEQYSAIFRKLDQYQKIGGKTVGGESIGDIKAQVKAAEDQLKAAAALKLETAEIAKNEKLATDIVKQRTDAYKDIEDRVKAGTITPEQGMDEARAKAKDFDTQMKAIVEKAVEFNEQMRGKKGIDNELIDKSNSRLQRQQRETDSDTGKALRGVADNLDKQQEGKVNEILKERNDLTQAYANLVKLGLMTETDAQKQLQADYARTNKPLNDAIDAYETLIQKNKDFMTAGDFELATAKIKTFRSQVQYLDPEFVKLKNAVQDAFTHGFTDAFDKTAESIADLIDGTHNLGDTWKDMKNIVLDFFASFAKSIANAIVQIEAMRIAQSMTSGSGSLFGSIAGFFTSSGSGEAAVSHAGGIVGGSAVTRRAVDWRVFENAPRYHAGTNGPLGLKPGERATILQDGEEVLSAAQRASAARQQAGGKVQAVPVRQVLAIGDDEVSKAMAGSAGEDVTLTHIRRNADQVKQWLK